MLAIDTEWRSLLKNASSLQDPRQHYPQWLLLIQTSPRYWKRLVRRAGEHAVLQRCKKQHQVKDFHVQALERIWQLLPEDLHPEPATSMPEGVFGCLSCQLRCRSKAGEEAHMFKRHQQCSQLRRLSDHTVCPACLKNFHTMQKLKAHLYHSSSCQQTLYGRNHFCQIAPGCGSM